MSTLLMVFPLASLAEVECRDIITTAEVLTENLICSDTPALTIEGPTGSLNMNGFTLECRAPDRGIDLLGTGAVLSNGIIEDCSIGVFVNGDGFHSVQSMTIQDSFDIGILLLSENNTVSGSTVTGSINRAIDILGANNSVIGNFIFDNQGGAPRGIAIGGDNAFVSQNFCDDNEGAGIVIESSSGGLVIQNVVTNNSQTGISMEGGGQSDYLVAGNIATDNPDGDLVDSNPDACMSTNLWYGNIFDTADPSCLE
ncbi:right-handed parallel beta-helix repeat-containing protein [Microbulbifer sp. A4B17]|uniref:right-handed parallel beta-helix repeat-containing protein n=1 Tax=Microbulbifer sp. A4B17 TaxID=359370 RepID=UPI001300729F|nr:right-handed parallel beta-helix repeat-containing protein [Microbulbifer sp. A4B17]